MENTKEKSFTFGILCWLARLVSRIRFGYTCDSLASIEGPYLLLANHNVDFDPAFIAVATGRKLHYVASEHIMHLGLISRFLKWYMQPIIHTKGKLGTGTVRQMLKTLRSGGSVCMFPEGGRSFTGITGRIPSVTGKLAKQCGTKVVTFRIEGGYLTQPRWGKSIRKGRMFGHLAHVYLPEELKAMTDEELTLSIEKDLYENAFETQTQNPVPFKGKNLALGMEAVLFACPRCNSMGTLSTDGRKISCTCGYSAAFDEFGNLKDEEKSGITIPRWDALQRRILRDRAERASGPIFKDKVILKKYNADHEVESERKAVISAGKDCIFLDEKPIDPQDIDGLAIYSRNTMVLHYGKDMEHYEISGGISFNALKYQYLYQLYFEKKEK